MDVVRGSIDLRELLPSGGEEIDESSPLSSPDLRLLIDRLQVRSLDIKRRVAEYVRDHHRDFADILSRSVDTSSKVDDLAASLATVLRLFDEGPSGRPLDAELRSLVEESRRKRRELAEKKEALRVVRVISDLAERLDAVREGVEAGRLVEAAGGVRYLQTALSVPDEWKDGGGGIPSRKVDPVAFSLLRTQWVECFERLQRVLVEHLENAVHFESESGRLVVRNQVDGVELQSVLKALDIIGLLNYGLARVADLLNKFVIMPVIGRKAGKVSVDEPSEGMVEIVLHPEPSPVSQAKSLDVVMVYPMLIDVLKFAYNFICFQNGTWMGILGRLTWPQISDSIIMNFLSKVVPSEASKVAEYQGILKATEEFEGSLGDILFIPMTDGQNEKLTRFAQNVEVHFASRKKNEIVAKARKLLLSCDFSLSQENTRRSESLEGTNADNLSNNKEDIPFWPNVRLVSRAASQLMKLVRETLEDASVSSNMVALEFYHAARDSLLLYLVIIPVKLEKQLKTVSQAAILVYNDLLHLSQEALGLAFEYRAFAPSALSELMVFVDIAPNFQQLAAETLQKQIQLTDLNIKEALDGANGFQNTHQRQNFESAKFAIDQVVFVLEKVHILWEPVLIPATYRRTLCSILDRVFSRINEDVLQLDDLGADETLQLQRLIYIILENLSTLFETIRINKSEDRRSDSDVWFELENLIPSLCKLRKLADLLDMSLKSITAAWEDGSLASCGFSKLEVLDFVKAIFADSPIRKECLSRIESAYF
ncbi:centromere/kinetochore protein zw10 homolog [Nymphaea colorata]|nr:centromere/kinetochore protein zw10 homolog [Nymphaea colorata]